MKKPSGTKHELIKEISVLKRRIQELEFESPHRQMEDEAHELLLMLESVPNGIVVHDAEGNFLYANQRACDMHGYSPHEFIALNLHRITVPASEELVDARIQGLFDRGEISFEVEHLRKDGTILPLWINAKKATWGGKNVLLSVQTDLTERKRAEEVIGRMAMILDIAPNSITVHGFDGRFIYANQKTFDLHGFDRDEFLALNLHQLDVPESENLIASRMQELLTRGEATFKASHYRKDGSTLPLEVSARITTWGDKKVILSIATDISDRIRMEEDLLQARKLESLGVLADGIAHDFNNLMAIVQGFVDLALTYLPPDHVSSQQLLAAIESVQQTKDLTRRLITFARGGGPHREILDVAEIIREAVNRIAKGTKIRVKSDFAKNRWPVELDELQIKQCFYNLTLNAVEAMPGGGTLSIQAENAEISGRDVLDLKEGPYLKITFIDEGVGIPKDRLSKIFDPYFTTKTMGVQKGLGLGLSVCYSVLKNHDGHITVKSQPGEGTSFTLYIPARVDLAKEKASKQTSSTDMSRVPTIRNEP
jgi:PAS domain S-box-containing protein